MNFLGTVAYRAPVGGQIPESFTASVVPAFDFLVRQFDLEMEEGIYFMRGLSCMPFDAANKIVEGFRGDWVLMLDPDHVFSDDTLYEMVRTFEGDNALGTPLDILTGLVHERREPYRPILFKTKFNPWLPFERITSFDRHSLFQVDSGGAGCLMVRRRVFDAIEKMGERPFDMRPKFNTTDLLNGKKIHPAELKELTSDRNIHECFWEDVSFFWRAQMLGFKAYCAPWALFYHIEQRLIGPAATASMVKFEDPIPR